MKKIIRRYQALQVNNEYGKVNKLILAYDSYKLKNISNL